MKVAELIDLNSSNRETLIYYLFLLLFCDEKATLHEILPKNYRAPKILTSEIRKDTAKNLLRKKTISFFTKCICEENETLENYLSLLYLYVLSIKSFVRYFDYANKLDTKTTQAKQLSKILEFLIASDVLYIKKEKEILFFKTPRKIPYDLINNEVLSMKIKEYKTKRMKYFFIKEGKFTKKKLSANSYNDFVSIYKRLNQLNELKKICPVCFKEVTESKCRRVCRKCNDMLKKLVQSNSDDRKRIYERILTTYKNIDLSIEEKKEIIKQKIYAFVDELYPNINDSEDASPQTLDDNLRFVKAANSLKRHKVLGMLEEYYSSREE